MALGVGMQYGDINGEDDGDAQTRTAFREAEKKYQLFRERIMKMKRGKKKAGKMMTRPIDMSYVLDLHGRPSDSLPPGVVHHVVQGYEGPVYTFTRHPGFVYMPGALPEAQHLQLTAAALTDYPEPPARTNHDLHYGPLPGLWRAAQAGLRLNWGRRDEQRAGLRAAGPVGGRQACGRSAPEPHSCAVSADGVDAAAAPAAEEDGSVGAELASVAAVAPSRDSNLISQALTCGLGGVAEGANVAVGCPSQNEEDQHVLTQDQPCCSGWAFAGEAPASSAGEARAAKVVLAAERHQEQQLGTDPYLAVNGVRTVREGRSCGAGARGDCDGPEAAHDTAAGVDGCCCCLNNCSNRSNRSSTSGGSAEDGGGGDGGRSHRSSGSGSDCVERPVEAAPPYEACWSTDGPGPPAELLLRKLRWATLGPQFEWTERRYDFEGVFRPLPPSLESLAKQLAAVVENLQGAGLEVLPPAAAAGGYKPDAAIVNYYQQGDVLGGHLDDVERDMAQPIVSVSLGCPAIFLMGGPTKNIPPSAILVRGGDVMVLAGKARRCYHGVPRILEAESCGAGGGQGPSEEGGTSPVDSYTRRARINISIRAAA